MPRREAGKRNNSGYGGDRKKKIQIFFHETVTLGYTLSHRSYSLFAISESLVHSLVQSRGIKSPQIRSDKPASKRLSAIKCIKHIASWLDSTLSRSYLYIKKKNIYICKYLKNQKV